MRRFLRSFNNALVLLQCSLDDLAPARLDELGDIRPMSMLDEHDVRTWLDIHNDAYGRSWNRAHYQAWILDHPHVDVLQTYLLYQDGSAVGAGSTAVFRRNRAIGVAHYVGIRKAYQGHGLGRRLMLFRYHTLREHGVASFEMETTIGRRASIWAHFNCGFKPKPRFDAWNTYDQAAPWLRALTRARLERLYEQWRRR